MGSFIEVTDVGFHQQETDSAGNKLVCVGASCGVRFYRKNAKEWRSFREADLIIVPCNQELKQRPATKGETGPQPYLQHRDHVRLEGSDTFLYHVHNWMPLTHAEHSMIRGYLTLLASGVIAACALATALLLGSGWWSLLWACGGIVGTLLYSFVLDRYLRIVIAASAAAIYVWKQVLFLGKSRRQYHQTVSLLCNCPEPYLRPICKLLKFMV